MDYEMGNGEKRHSTKKTFIVFLGIILCLFVMQLCTALYMVYSYKEVYRGVTLEGIDISRLDDKDLTEIIELTLEDKKDKKVTFKYKEYEKIFSIDEILDMNTAEEIKEKAYNIGRSGNFFSDYFKILNLLKNHEDITISKNVQADKLEGIVNSIKLEIDREMTPIVIEKKPSENFVITGGLSKRILDFDKTLKSTKEKIESYNDTNIIIDLNVSEEVNPKGEEHYKKLMLLGEYSTKFSAYDLSRNTNLAVATSKINGTILESGEILSVNKTISPVNTANGYKTGKIIVGGKLVDGIGGGVCQVSTTLYNAVLYSELEIIERKNHSLPVGYVPLGRDAALASPYTDFKFKNSTKSPIYIEGYIENNQVIFKIYGDQSEKKYDNIEFRRTTSRVIYPVDDIIYDNTMLEGETLKVAYGKNGYVINTYAKKSKDGTVIKDELVSVSTYKATPGKVKVGTKQIVSAEVPPVQVTQDEVNNEN